VNKTRNTAYINAFGENLRSIRLKKRFTMLELAFEADIEYSQIAKIERGVSNPTISTIYVLAKALNVKVIELFRFADPEVEK
jgi:transcriptional regulator with XRE-family HTH domain